jgi:hypothetical protein
MLDTTAIKKTAVVEDRLTIPGPGLEVHDVEGNAEFAQRNLHHHDLRKQTAGFERLAKALKDRPNSILQELVETAADVCGADSAGISLTQSECDAQGEAYPFLMWVATAGKYGRFLDGKFPRIPSPCNEAIDRGRPQQFTISKAYFDMLGAEAEPVTDGLMLPWDAAGERGTIWIMAHGRTEAFDASDLAMLQLFKQFVALGITLRERQSEIHLRWASTAASAMESQLAAKIEGPLTALADQIFVAANGKSAGDARSLATELERPLEQLTQMVDGLLRRSPVARPN